ncbi:VOC family protein [halophilic archaeon]|nr:VOC family protein [halophilic archaeon]
MTTESEEPFELPPESHVGSVALQIGSLDNVLPFYRNGIGFDVERDGDDARLIAGDQPLLVLHEESNAPERPPAAAGLFHVAMRVPDRGTLADVLNRIRKSDVTLLGTSDHLVSEALYLRDPEGNGIEVYCDRPQNEWPRTADGGIEMDTLPLDLDDLSEEGSTTPSFPAGVDIGHIHLEVTDLPRSEIFYRDTLGLRVQTRYGDEATFLAAGNYHHHVGLNTWNHRQSPTADTRGLDWFQLVVPDTKIVEVTRRRLHSDDYQTTTIDGGISVSDPDGIQVRLTAEG